MSFSCTYTFACSVAAPLGVQCLSAMARSSAGQRPVVIQIGDHLSHEWLGERDRAIFVAEMIVENGKSQLLRARAFVGPLEAPFGELLNFVMLGQPTAIDCDFKTVDVACSLIGLHGSRRQIMITETQPVFLAWTLAFHHGQTSAARA